MDEIQSQDVIEAEIEPEAAPAQDSEASTDVETEHLESAEEAGSEEESEEAPPEVSPEPSPTEQPVITPFSFAADGKRVQVEGASLVEHTLSDGKKARSVVIPEDVFQRKVQPYLADRGSFAKKEREYQRQLADLSPDRNETVIRAQTTLDEFEKILSTEESLTQFLENFDRNREVLKLKVENAAVQAKLKARETVEHESRTERDTEETVGMVHADVPQVVQSAGYLLKTRYGVDASPQALQAAYEQIMENLPAYYRRATALDVQEHPDVAVGEVVRDDDAVLRTVNRFSSLLKAGSEQKARTDEAARRNQAALGGTKKVAPSVSAKGSASPGERKTEIKSKEDFYRVMGVDF